MSWNFLENQKYNYKYKYKYKYKHKYICGNVQCDESLQLEKQKYNGRQIQLKIQKQLQKNTSTKDTIDFATTGGDNTMQMVQMSKTLSTKSIRDDLCTDAGTGRGTSDA